LLPIYARALEQCTTNKKDDHLAQMKFIETESEDYFDVVTVANFEHRLESNDTLEVLKIVLDTLSHKTALRLFDELVSLEINPECLGIRLRYYINRQGEAVVGIHTTEDENRVSMQFILYLFAKVDQRHKLGEVPFTQEFHRYIELLSGLFEP
jgi:hypothetical protein